MLTKASSSPFGADSGLDPAPPQAALGMARRHSRWARAPGTADQGSVDTAGVVAGFDGTRVGGHCGCGGRFWRPRFEERASSSRGVANAPDQFPKRAPIGVYDESILCEACEPIFGEWDDYAQRLLTVEGPGAPRTMPNGSIIGWEVPEYRYDLLKLFFVSVLWRASVSTQRFYQRIDLGPFEATAKKLIESRNASADRARRPVPAWGHDGR